MALSGTSFSNVSSPTVGQAIIFDEPVSRVGLAWLLAPSATNLQLVLEGTVDGSTWFQLAIQSGGTFAYSGFIASDSMPVIGIRANLTAFTTTSGATISAWLSAEYRR